MTRIKVTRKRKIATAAVTATVAAATLGVGLLSQASANPAPPPCATDGLMCVYLDPDYQGGAAQTATTSLPTLDNGLNDAISSLTNYSGKKMCFFEDPYYKGEHLEFENRYLVWGLGKLEDKISSYGPCETTLPH